MTIRLSETSKFYARFDDENHLHSENDMPAVEYKDGSYKAWHNHGLFHRLYGPAREWNYNHKEWYLNDKRIFCQTNEEFLRIVKLRHFL